MCVYFLHLTYPFELCCLPPGVLDPNLDNTAAHYIGKWIIQMHTIK